MSHHKHIYYYITHLVGCTVIDTSGSQRIVILLTAILYQQAWTLQDSMITIQSAKSLITHYLASLICSILSGVKHRGLCIFVFDIYLLWRNDKEILLGFKWHKIRNSLLQLVLIFRYNVCYRCDMLGATLHRSPIYVILFVLLDNEKQNSIFDLSKKKEKLFKQLAQLGLSLVISLHGARVWSMIYPEASPPIWRKPC